MKSFMEKHAKLIYFAYGVLLFAVLISALFFMTQYRYIRVNFTEDWKGISFGKDVALDDGTQQQALYRFFARPDVAAGAIPGIANYKGTFNTFAETVFNFKRALDAFNDLIVTFSLIGILCFAGLLIAANHSRKVYYKSNLILGIALPTIVIVFAIVMIVQEIGLIGEFQENETLFNVVSVLQNPVNEKYSKVGVDVAEVTSRFDCDLTTFIVYICIFAVVIIYSVFLIIYAWLRYSNCAEKRKSILEKAGTIQC